MKKRFAIATAFTAIVGALLAPGCDPTAEEIQQAVDENVCGMLTSGTLLNSAVADFVATTDCMKGFAVNSTAVVCAGEGGTGEQRPGGAWQVGCGVCTPIPGTVACSGTGSASQSVNGSVNIKGAAFQAQAVVTYNVKFNAPVQNGNFDPQRPSTKPTSYWQATAPVSIERQGVSGASGSLHTPDGNIPFTYSGGKSCQWTRNATVGLISSASCSGEG